jgi:hypothetical protein
VGVSIAFDVAALMLRALMRAPKRTLSIWARAAKSCGLIGTGTAPMASMRAMKAGLRRILLISVLRRETTAGGVAEGA